MIRIEFRKVNLNDSLEKLVEFFQNNVDTNYISYADIHPWNRALDYSTWSPDLDRILYKELTDIVNGISSGQIAYCGFSDETLISLAIVSIEGKIGHIEDIVVSKDSRGNNIGSRFLEFISSELKELGADEIILQSGARNERTHSFFQKNQFELVTKTFRKRL